MANFRIRNLFTVALSLTTWFTTLSANSQPLKLSAPNGNCATGFILEGGDSIVTNYHVASGFCKRGICREIKLETESSDFVDTFDLKIARALPALDIAVLEPSRSLPINIKRFSFSQSMANVGDALQMRGFPACQGYVESSGTIQERHPLYLRTTITGASGSSGSPILNTAGEVVGVANESDSFLQALTDKLAGASFAMRATPSDLIQKSLSLSAELMLQEQFKILLEFYHGDLQAHSGIARLRGSVNFLSRVSALRGLLLETSPESEIVAIAAYLDQAPGLFISSSLAPPKLEVSKLAEQLFFAANLEARGIAMAPSAENIKDSGREEPQVAALLKVLETAKKNNFPGTIALGAITGVPVVLVIAALLVFYGLTLGVVFARAKGGIIIRTVKMLLVGVLFWPISLLVWWMFSPKR